MKISTKTGDSGSTSLLYGGRVKKDSLRVETCGTLDELCSFLGLAKSLLKNKDTKRAINRIQTDLYVIVSEIATKPSYLNKLKRRLNRNDVRYLEAFIEKLERRYKFRECCFILPGENILSAALDASRVIARRAERRILSLKNRRSVKNRSILTYLNRLSDLLFLLARSYEKKQRKVRHK